MASAEILKERGAYKIYIMATHGLLSADAPRLIEESAIDEVTFFFPLFFNIMLTLEVVISPYNQVTCELSQTTCKRKICQQMEIDWEHFYKG